MVICQQVQYKFLHEVILEAYTSRDTRLNVEQLDVEFPSDIDVNKPNERIDNEFKARVGLVLVCVHGIGIGLCVPCVEAYAFLSISTELFSSLVRPD